MSKFWFRLDNAAMIFPPISGKKAPNTFCLSAVLDKKIDKKLLQEAVSQVVKSEDTFRVRLKKGIFWYYLEENNKEPVVLDEPANFMEFIDYRKGDNYLFRVYVRENRISVVFFHVLTDGTGGLYFLKQIIYRYLINCGYSIDTEGLLKPIEIPTTNEESSDQFMDIDLSQEEEKIFENKAFKLTGTPFKVFGTGLICAECNTEKVKTLAKSYGTTITGYLCGVYMFSLYKAYIENKNCSNKTISISIPVNIRKQHPSATKRNFSLVVRISYNFSNQLTLDDVIKSCAEQLNSKVTKNQLDAQIKFNTSAEKNIFMRMAPRVIKSLILKLAYKIKGAMQESTNLSNLGITELPAEVAKHVKKIYFMLQASQTTQKNLSVIGFEDKLYMTFSRRHIETVSEKYFFKTLIENGVNIELNSNYQEARR